MGIISKDLGPVTAYAAAVNRGYTGTREEFETLMASYATVAEQAGESAESAEESAASAAQSAANASQSAQNAESSKYNALLYSNQANGYKNTANTAAQAAKDARDTAQVAQTAAEAAQEGAEAAVDGFDSAVTQAISDVNAAGTNQKELAKRQAEKSEAWAVGKINGEDVGVSDPAYHNNAKYYAEQAAESARTLTIDSTLTQLGQAADAKAVGDRIEETEGNLDTLKSDLEEHGILKTHPIVTYLGNYTIGSNGALTANANYDTYAVRMNGCESVVVNTANIYGFFNGPLEITSTYRPYTTDGTRHFDASNAELTTDAEYIVCVNAVTSGVVVTARNADDTETIQESIERLENDVKEIDNAIGSVFVQYNLSQAIKIANHRIRFDKTIEEIGLIDYYKIPVEEGGVYRVTNIVRTQNCLYCFFDSNDNITYAYPSTNQPNENVLTTETVTIPTGVVCLGINDLTRWQSVSPIVEKQVKQLTDEAIPSNILRSPLKGLYLVTAGDSVTIGHGIEDSGSMTDDERPTYGKLASDFYGTRYHNIGMSGRTMADIKVDGVTRNGFAVDRYQLVPDDTDILTIWFGWNDCAHGANSMRDNYCLTEYGNLYSACSAKQQTEADTHDWESAFISTINSTDKTTWSGAWNFVLEYFTVTKPIEHLGVIIPFLPLGSFASAMRERLAEICKNYGVSYIDSANPNEIPTVAYCDSNRNTNYKNYLAYRTKYTADTLHPNKAGYKRIARGYIPWIARI